MDKTHPLLPGPRPPPDFTLAASYPPAPRRWSGQAPISQSRGGYTSPDASPTSEEHFFSHQHPNETPEYPFPHPDYYPHGQEHEVPHPQMMRGGGGMYKGVQPAPGMGEIDPFYYPVMPQRHPSQDRQGKRTKGGRKVDGKQPTFLTKLYQILDQQEYHHIIRWDEAGEVIIIEKPDELADKILPLVYRQSRFASFSRQLNIYGFMRKVSLRHVDREICDPDASTWSHPFLRRSSTAEEIQGFKRRVPPRPSQAAKRRASVASAYHDESMGLSPTSSEGSYQSPPDAYQHHLLADLEEEKPVVFHTPQGLQAQLDASSPDSAPEYRPFMPRNNGFNPSINGRPIAPKAPPPLPANLFFDRDGTNPVLMIPASAPAHITNFPTTHRIAQGHIRTRSVQGEPPSATLFSPTSPLAQASWMPEDYERALRGDGGVPTYNPNDASTWVRRGYTDLTNGAMIAAPAVRLGATPSSVPNDFAPTGYVPQHVNNHSNLNPNVSATVSPGVYQAGFALPYKSAYTPSTPRAVPSRQERRASISSSPYSPRSRPPGASSLGGVIRGLSASRTSTERHDVVPNDDEALPSAGLRGFHPEGPFEGVLPEEGNMSGTVGQG